jgi:hypothetical protein
MSKTVIYPVDRQDYMFYIRGAIGGTDRRSKIVRLLVDTGARNTVLPAQLLRELGCNLDNPQRNIQITAAGGVLQVPRIIVPWFNCLGNRCEQQAPLTSRKSLPSLRSVIDHRSGGVALGGW